MKGDRKFAPLFSVWQIDAWAEGEDGWTWNDKYRLFDFRTNSLDVKRVFLKRLRRHLADVKTPSGVVQHFNLGRGWYYVTDDWHIMELCRRKDHCPIYACIRETP